MVSALQLPLAGRPHRNQQLFSDHYLDEILPNRPEWKLDQGEAARLLAAVQQIYARFRPSNEAQTEHELARPAVGGRELAPAPLRTCGRASQTMSNGENG